MNVADLRSKSPADLKKELNELLKEQMNLRLQKGLGEAPKTHLYNQVRKNIARVKTILNEKNRGSND